MEETTGKGYVSFAMGTRSCKVELVNTPLSRVTDEALEKEDVQRGKDILALI